MHFNIDYSYAYLLVKGNKAAPNTAAGTAVNNTNKKVIDNPKSFQQIDPKAIQQINFTENLTREGGARMYFIFEEAKETVLYFSKGTVKVL